jgi:hypothetical protein
VFDVIGIPWLVKQLFVLGVVDSDTGKSSLSAVLVYNACIEPYRWSTTCDKQVFMQYIIPEYHYNTEYLQYSKSPYE